MTTAEESQNNSDSSSLHLTTHANGDSGTKKIRRGRPKSRTEPEPLSQTPETPLPQNSMTTATQNETIIPPASRTERTHSDENKQDTTSQASFSFSPNDETAPEIDRSENQFKSQEAEKPAEKPKHFHKKSDFHNKYRHHHKHPQQQKPHNPQAQKQPPGQPSSKGQYPQAQKSKASQIDLGGLVLGNLPHYDLFKNKEALSALATELSTDEAQINFNELYELPLQDLAHKVSEFGLEHEHIPHRRTLLLQVLNWAKEQHRAIIIQGIFEKLDNGGLIVYKNNNYAIKDFSAFIPESLVKEFGLLRGHEIQIQAHPPREGETCPFALKILKIMDADPEEVAKRIPFEDLIPYYPTTRLFLETKADVTWDNISMRIVDILAPIGLGQRGLIVAPPADRENHASPRHCSRDRNEPTRCSLNCIINR